MIDCMVCYEPVRSNYIQCIFCKKCICLTCYSKYDKYSDNELKLDIDVNNNSTYYFEKIQCPHCRQLGLNHFKTILRSDTQKYRHLHFVTNTQDMLFKIKEENIKDKKILLVNNLMKSILNNYNMIIQSKLGDHFINVVILKLKELITKDKVHEFKHYLWVLNDKILYN